MKLAIMLAGMASGNKIARDPAQLLQQGTRLVQSSPQLSALSDQARSRLIEAGKSVAVVVVSRRMDSLSDRLSEHNQRLSERLDERTGSGPPTRSGRATEDTQPADDWVEEDRWGEEDRADVDDDRTVPHHTGDGSQRGEGNA